MDNAQWIVQGGSFALVVFLVWHYVTKAEPERVRQAQERETQFLGELDRKRKDYEVERRFLCDQFTATLNQQRIDFTRTIETLNRERREELAAFEREIRGMAAAVHRNTIAILVHHNSTLPDHPEARAGTKDLLDMLHSMDDDWSRATEEQPRPDPQ